MWCFDDCICGVGDGMMGCVSLRHSMVLYALVWCVEATALLWIHGGVCSGIWYGMVWYVML